MTEPDDFSNEEMDLDVDHYTISELYAILDLPEDSTSEDILYVTNGHITTTKENGDIELYHFFQDAQDKLLEFYDDPSSIAEQTDHWYRNEVLPQQDNPVQADKTTDRVQKIDVFNDEHLAMNREQLGVNNTVSVPVAQDTLNPNLENTTSRLINLDSQFRQAANTLSTDYTLDLSDPLTNTLNLRLYSFQIPYTWYLVDSHYGNSCFWVSNLGKVYSVRIDYGNYTSSTMVTALNAALTTAGFTWGGVNGQSTAVSYNGGNGKISISLYGWLDPEDQEMNVISSGGTFDIETNAYFLFFDVTGQYVCEGLVGDCGAVTSSFSSTLGWLLGYRLPIVPLVSDVGGNIAAAVLDVHGPKYFILVIDDYNQNHINNGLVSITQLSTKLAMPSYYVPTMPYVCVDVTSLNGSGGVLDALAESGYDLANANVLNSLADKLDVGQGQVQQILPSAPRTLTQAQLYTINEIKKNREKTTTYRAKAPTTSDTFALIPIKKGSIATGDLYVDFSGSLQDNKRVYFGPVDIDRLRIRLLDDRGNTVNLHGCDWCVTLIAELLYQY